MSLREIEIMRPEDLRVLLTTHESNCCCDACGNVLAAIDFMKTLLDQAQAVTVERCSDVAFVSCQDNEHCMCTSEMSTAIRALSPDAQFLARKVTEARVEEAKWWDGMWQPSGDCGGRREQHIAELERDLATLGEGK